METEYDTKIQELEMLQSKGLELENQNTTQYQVQIDSSISKGEVQAQSTGYLNLTKESRTGDYLAAGTALGSIVPGQESSYIVQIYLNNQDIGKVKEGATVRYEIPAYPSSEYGNITGEILRISEDLKINQDAGTGYYLAEATIVLPEGIGNVKMKQGMAVEAKVVVEEKSVFEFLMEKIGFMN